MAPYKVSADIRYADEADGPDIAVVAVFPYFRFPTSDRSGLYSSRARKLVAPMFRTYVPLVVGPCGTVEPLSSVILSYSP